MKTIFDASVCDMLCVGNLLYLPSPAKSDSPAAVYRRLRSRRKRQRIMPSRTRHTTPAAAPPAIVATLVDSEDFDVVITSCAVI